MPDWLSRMVPLTEADVPQMLMLQEKMLLALPDKRWYFPNAPEEFAQDTRCGYACGLWEKGALIAFGVACAGETHPGGCYAAKVGDESARSFDFRDVIVDPAWRRQGIHSAFLTFFRRRAEALGCRAMYATVDPDNVPSFRSFEKAGFVRLRVMPAYDGRIRAYYRLLLGNEEACHPKK